MKNISKKIALGLVFLLLMCLFAHSQKITGSLKGVVLDDEGKPLPGVLVTASSPSMLGIQSFITTSEGIFRFPSLSSGIYLVSAELDGFQVIKRANVIVYVGKSTEITIEMKPSKVREEVIVTAPSPMVDVQSSKLADTYNAQFIASIPMNRDISDIQNSIPGAINDGGPAYRRTSSILGGTVRSQFYALDGAPMNDPAVFYAIANINVDVYDEVEFSLGAHPAEIGQTDSTYINIVTKSGGNNLSGGATFHYTGKNLAKDLISAGTIQSIGVYSPERYDDYKDLSTNLGGPIIKDKIWFFLSGRRLTWDEINPRTPESRLQIIADANPGLFSATDLQHYNFKHEEWLGFGKLTIQLTGKIKYMGMFHYNHIYEPVSTTGRIGDNASWAYTSIYNHENTYTTTHHLNFILDQNTFLDLRGSFVKRYFPLSCREEYAGNYTYYDKKNVIYWGNTTYTSEYVRQSMPITVSMTRFLDNFIGANHEFKAGVDFEQTEYHRDWYRLGNPYFSDWLDFNAGDPYYYSSSKRQGRLRLYACPGEKGQWDVQDHTRRFSGYFQDSVTKKRVTLNLGVRLDYSYLYEPEQSRPELRYDYGPALQASGLSPNALLEALINQFHTEIGPISPFDALTSPYKKPVEFMTVSPRIGLVYDILGDGKTALKLSFSRYHEPIWSSKYNNCQIFGASVIEWRWNDNNKNKIMDLPPVDSYQLTSYSEQDPKFDYYPKDLKAPYMNEFIAGIERELYSDFKLGFQFIYKVNKNLVEDIDRFNGYDPNATDEEGLIWLPYTVTDPGWDGEFGTGDDKTVTIYGLREDRPIPSMCGYNPPEAKRKYWAAVLTFDKRMSNKWQLKGSLIYSKFKGNVSPTYDATSGDSEIFNTPNTLINGYGCTAFDRPLQMKIMGTCILPYDFILSAYFQYLSGTPWRRTINRIYFPSGAPVQQTYVGINAEPLGTRRNEPYTNLDLRLEKSFSFGGSGKLNIYVDIFNVFGRSGFVVNNDPNGYLYYFDSPPSFEYDSVYGSITSVYGVRYARLGIRLEF